MISVVHCPAVQAAAASRIAEWVSPALASDSATPARAFACWSGSVVDRAAASACWYSPASASAAATLGKARACRNGAVTDRAGRLSLTGDGSGPLVQPGAGQRPGDLSHMKHCWHEATYIPRSVGPRRTGRMWGHSQADRISLSCVPVSNQLLA